MNQFDELFGFGEDEGLDIPLIADNHLFSNGPDMFENDLSGWLRKAIDSPRLANKAPPSSQGFTQEHLPLASSDGAYFEDPDDLFKDIDFGVEQMNVLSLPDQPVPNIGDVGLTFDQTFPQNPPMPVPTIDPAVLLHNNMWQQPIVSASVPKPDNAFAWHSMGTNNLMPMPSNGQQQQWPVFVHQQAQFHQTQPNVAQVQYMQAVQQFQFAQNQLALSMQPPLQLPVSAQPHTDQQSLEQAHDPLQSQDLPSQEPQPAQDVQALQTTPIGATPPELPRSPSPVLQAATTTPSDQEQPESPPLPRLKRKARVSRKSDPTQDAHTPEQSYGRLTFTSLREAEAAMPGRYLEKGWRAPISDETVPDTNEDRAYWVLKVLDAMQDTSTCKDNKDGFSFVKRWRQAGYYNNQEMEKVCWDIVDIAERLHAKGPSATKIYCHDAHKKMYSSRNLSFEQRIVAICDMLKLSKFLCDNLMKGEGTEALIGAPKQKMSGAKTMVRQNLKRQNWLEEGRRKDARLSKGKTDLPEDKQDVNVNEADVTKPTPRKPKQKSKRFAPASKPRARTLMPENSDEDESRELARRQSSVDSPTNESELTTSPKPTPVSTSPLPSPSPPSRKQKPATRSRGLGRPPSNRTTRSMEPDTKLNGTSRKRAIDLTESDSDEETPAPPAKRMRGPKDGPKKRFEGSVRRRLRSAGSRGISQEADSEMEVDEASREEAALEAASRKEDAEHETDGDEDDDEDDDEESEVESRAASSKGKNKPTTPVDEPDVSEPEAQSDEEDNEAETDDNNSDDENEDEIEDENEDEIEVENEDEKEDENENENENENEDEDEDEDKHKESEESSESSDSSESEPESESDSDSDSDSDYELTPTRKRKLPTAKPTPFTTAKSNQSRTTKNNRSEDESGPPAKRTKRVSNEPSATTETHRVGNI
ncbi:hypothetical protein N0V95_009440 [Ascochyta clinopodiicola]|nr:hypothetical protein N0V95_009440 [Ascochyta clinopodiicola]